MEQLTIPLQQQVVLVNENDETIGVMEKMAAHEQALLHRAFSVFLFDSEGRMLLQQRSLSKYHSGGLWTNACCSHPYPGEEVHDAAVRRLGEELNIRTEISKAFHFTYKAVFDNGLTEHEYDHVYTGHYDQPVAFNTDEVMAVQYITMAQLDHEMSTSPENFTAWFKIALPEIKKYLTENGLMTIPATENG